MSKNDKLDFFAFMVAPSLIMALAVLLVYLGV